MLNKFKFKFKNFVSRWKLEKHLIKTCNRATPLHQKVSYVLSFVFCFVLLLFFVGCISASAAEEPDPRDYPTDLTGYTVTVPANWEATVSFGRFNLQGTLNDQTFASTDAINFYIGEEEGISRPNYVSIYNSDYVERSFYHSSSLTLNISGGLSVTDSSLIQWLVDNNATFEGGSIPEPEVYTVPSGYYKLASLPSQGVPSVGGFSPGIEHLFETPVQLFYSSGIVKQYTYFGFVVSQFTDSNNFSVDFTVQLLDISNPVRVANLTAVDGVCTSQFYGGISNIYFDESFSIDEISQQLILFTFELDSSFVPDEPDVPEIPYNPWAYILDMIIEALKTPLFGYFSIWDIYVTICSIFLVTWLLKLLAGG